MIKKIHYYLYCIALLSACHPAIVADRDKFITIYHRNGSIIGKYPQNSRWLGFDKQEHFDLHQLNSFTNLQRLELTASKYHDFQPLRNHKKLMVLELAQTSFHSLSTLPDLPLYRLNLSETRIDSLIGIERFARLTYLAINQTNITDLQPVGKLTELRHLYAQNTPITDLAPLRNCNKLTELYLRGSQIQDLSPLYDLAELTFLETAGLNIPNHQIQHIRQKQPYLVIIE